MTHTCKTGDKHVIDAINTSKCVEVSRIAGLCEPQKTFFSVGTYTASNNALHLKGSRYAQSKLGYHTVVMKCKPFYEAYRMYVCM